MQLIFILALHMPFCERPVKDHDTSLDFAGLGDHQVGGRDKGLSVPHHGL